MSYKYKQRLEWTESCKYATEYEYAIYKKLQDDIFNEYKKLKPTPINKKIYQSRIDYSQGFLAGLKYIESMFDFILLSSKSELEMYKQDALLKLYYIKEINKEWYKDDFYKKIKLKELTEINENIITEIKKNIDRKNKRFQENLDLNNKKDDKTIVLNLTQEDINNVKNNGDKNG